MALLLTLVAPAAFKRHEGVGSRSGEQASEEGVFWFVLSALPLVAAWLVAEFWFTLPSFSGNVFAFAATWAAFELATRAVVALVSRALTLR